MTQMGDQQTKLTLKAPIATKVTCFSRLPKCLRSLCDKQCGPRSDCSYMNSLIWVHPVASILKFVSNVRQLFAADDFSRRHFSDTFFLGAEVHTTSINVLCGVLESVVFGGEILRKDVLIIKVSLSAQLASHVMNVVKQKLYEPRH